MAGQHPFTRTIWNPLEKAFQTDWNNAQGPRDLALLETIRLLSGGRAGSGPYPDAMTTYPGFIGDGFKVRSPTSSTVRVAMGLGFLTNPNVASNVVGAASSGIAPSGVDDLAALSPVGLFDANQDFTVTTPPGAGNERYDIIEVKVNRHVGTEVLEPIWNKTAGQFDMLAVNKYLSWALDGNTNAGSPVLAPAASTAAISYVQGVVQTIASGLATAPTATPGYTIIGIIHVTGAAIAIADNVIQDMRPLLTPGGFATISASGVITAAFGAPSSPVFSMPPGMEAAWVSESPGASGNYHLYVKAGNTSYWNYYGGKSSLDFEDSGFATSILMALNGGMTVVPVDLAVQTALNGASPPMQAAIGQNVFRLAAVIGTLTVSAGALDFDRTTLPAGSFVLSSSIHLSRK